MMSLFITYLPPPSLKNMFTIAKFLGEFESFIYGIALTSTDIVILGDFNTHIDKTSNNTTSRFLDIQTVGFVQFVKVLTHKARGILDLIFSRPSLVNGVSVGVPDISDHSPIKCTAILTFSNQDPFGR